ncbi:MAG: hypothetical protein ABI054_09120 [Planctomycetota bacterium]
MLATGALHLAGILLVYLASLFFISDDLLVALLGIGITQLLWGAPLAMVFSSRGMLRAQRGVLIVLAITMLLNAMFFGLVMTLIR